MSEKINPPKSKIMPFVSLAATLAATGALHHSINEAEEGHGPRITVAEHTVDSHVDVSTEPIGPGTVDTITVDDPGNPEEKTSYEIVYPAAEYARLFDEDPAVLEVDTGASNEIKNTIDQLISDGWDVNISIQGNASAEDDTHDGQAGIQTPSQSNIDLANARRDALLDHLNTSGAIPEGVEINLLEGNEADTSARDAAVIIGVAEQFGYDSPEAMIKLWNDGEEVPPLVAETLNSFLGKNRNVMVTISGERVRPGSTEEVEQVVCVVPVKEVTTITDEKEPWKVTIPWIIPIIIPRVRRRKGDEGVTMDEGGSPKFKLSDDLKKLKEKAESIKKGQRGLDLTSLYEATKENKPTPSRENQGGYIHSEEKTSSTPEEGDEHSSVNDSTVNGGLPDSLSSSDENFTNNEHGQSVDSEASSKTESTERKKRKLKPILFITGGIAFALTSLGIGIATSNADKESDMRNDNEPELSRESCDPNLPRIEEVVESQTIHISKSN